MPRERRDVLIVGAGPAGLSAALWLRDFGLSALLLDEASQPGGQLHDIHATIPNYLTAYGWSGGRFLGVALADARAASLEILVGAPVTKLSARGPWVKRGRERFDARTVLLATGLRRRRLGVRGEAALLGKGVSHSANRDRERFAGRPVAVVGGGTAAVEDALICAEAGSPVLLIHRSRRFRARTDFLERARANPRIRFVLDATVAAIQGSERVEAIRYRERGGRRTAEERVDGVFVRIGWEPRTDLVRGVVRLDRRGYVVAGRGGRTSARNVYAAGDVCSPRSPSIATAVGQGATAAREIARSLGRVSD